LQLIIIIIIIIIIIVGCWYAFEESPHDYRYSVASLKYIQIGHRKFSTFKTHGLKNAKFLQ
jgi:hypothetical protein